MAQEKFLMGSNPTDERSNALCFNCYTQVDTRRHPPSCHV